MTNRGATLRMVVLFACCLMAPAHGAVELVRDGKAVSEIVIAPDALQGVLLAAEDLQKHLEMMSGAKLSIVHAPTAEVEAQIYVGESEHTRRIGFAPARFANSGLEILVRDNYIILDGPTRHWKPSPFEQSPADTLYLRGSVITGETFPKPANFPSPGLKAWQDFCGEKFTTIHLNNGPGNFNTPLKIHVNDDLGVWYAVAEFLEQLGIRWYMPYEHGTVTPEKKTIAVDDQHTRREARFARREWCYYNTMRGDGEGVAWLKRLKAGNHSLVLYNHTTYAIYSSYEQQVLHPEYLACDASGKPYLGYPTGRGMPRYTDPDFRRAAVVYMNKVLESQPGLSAIAIGPPDGGVKMDARDVPLYGKPDDTMNQKASNYVWDFHVFLARELKKSHPDKFLLYMSGAGAGEVPTNIEEFPDNLLIPPRWGNSSYRVLDSMQRAGQMQHRQWLDKMKIIQKAPSWDHWLNYRTPTHPRHPVVFTASLQRQMQESLPIIDGKFMEIQPDDRRDSKGRRVARLGVPGLVHLMVYLQNKLFWDPDLDRTALLEEYYTLFFGPAAAEMKEFYQFAETVWCRQESRSLTESTGFLKEPDVDRYFDLLSNARAKVEEGSVFHSRIAMIEAEMQPIKKLFPNLKRTGPLLRAYLAPIPLKIDGDLDEYKHGWAALRDLTTGEIPLKNASSAVIAITPDKSALVVGVVCHESRMGEIKAECRINDDVSIFQDDVVEVYVNSPERSYFKIVVNSNGALWDESTDVAIIERDTLPILWNPGVKAAVRKYDDRWTVEVMIPTEDFGKLGPTMAYPWGIQIGRTRFTGGHPEAWGIAPTGGGPYRTLNRWGNLWVR